MQSVLSDLRQLGSTENDWIWLTVEESVIGIESVWAICSDSVQLVSIYDGLYQLHELVLNNIPATEILRRVIETGEFDIPPYLRLPGEI